MFFKDKLLFIFRKILRLSNRYSGNKNREKHHSTNENVKNDKFFPKFAAKLSKQTNQIIK